MKYFVAKYLSFALVALSTVIATTDSAFYINKPEAPKELLK